MATISENLQTIKNSVGAIKQAISDKGGDVSGDISTWAGAISSIQSGGGGSEESEYIFEGTITRGMMGVTVTGSFTKPINVDIYRMSYLAAIGKATDSLTWAMTDMLSTSTGPYTLTVDYWEPIASGVTPALCLLYFEPESETLKILPIKFVEISVGTDPT